MAYEAMKDEAKQKVSQVDEQSEYLVSQTEQLHEVISILEQRLNRILKDEKPAQDIKGEEIQLVHFAEFLRVRAWNVQKARDRLTGILERLEL